MSLQPAGRLQLKFVLKHHWDGGKAALGFWQDRIRILVSMATYTSHRVIMGKTVLPLFLSCFSSDHFILGNKDMHESLEEFEVWSDPTTVYGVSLSVRKKSP